MGNLTVRAPDELLDTLDDEADERGVSRAEYVRRILRDRHASDERVEALEAELDECERERERVQRAHRQLLDQREEHTDLVRAVERERSLEERRAKAGWWTKLKWSALGMPDDEE